MGNDEDGLRRNGDRHAVSGQLAQRAVIVPVEPRQGWRAGGA